MLHLLSSTSPYQLTMFIIIGIKPQSYMTNESEILALIQAFN